ncbi:cilia- and flagella-associated protein 251-like [Apis dorsata]|uniref:cilia- and flagella-associated protein 251-like n=1 Tax=Apis dorsata TaxID=7462 RepID=UPI0003DF646C|nr:cilia- and flagella-associated protein 251-like [Apis dorsata]
MDEQVKSGHIIYITCPLSHEGLIGVTALKYSQIGDILACGLENGSLWMLHPITLEPIDKNPYKHSMQSIHKLAFSDCGEYLAYADNTLVVAVFKKNHKRSNDDDNIWNFIGKYRSHNADIKDILFGPATIESIVYRLFSIAEDKTLIEYNLKNSGPYPLPGLKILHVYKIENDAIPFCLEWYPQFGIEGLLTYSTSEYKFRLLNDMTKLIRGTFLGPLYSSPVKHIKVLSSKDLKILRYMVFATDKEIGLQILPFDGNPYKILGMIGHPHKITHICVNNDGNLLFTSGYNDPSILIWKIKYKSVDVLSHLGGKGLSPYYCLIEGGKSGWLIKEMQDLFYYSQILHQGENITSTRIISDKVNITELPNLMRSIGYYPSNEEIENFMGEIAYRDYAETGNLIDTINFEDFVKLYINHRPSFGISKHNILEAFKIFSNQLHDENPFLTRDQFMRLLLGHAPYTIIKKHQMPFGEPLTIQEAFTYMKFLIGFDEGTFDEINYKHEASQDLDLTFLPEIISYKYFITDILGIEFPEETRADDD